MNEWAAVELAKKDASIVHAAVVSMSAYERDDFDQTLTKYFMEKMLVDANDETIEQCIAAKCMIYLVYGQDAGHDE